MLSWFQPPRANPAPVPQGPSENLATLYSLCQRRFTAVLNFFRSRKLDRAGSFILWSDESSRFRLWGTNIGAAHTRFSASLDFRLRDAQIARDQIYKILSNLDAALHEALTALDAGADKENAVGLENLLFDLSWAYDDLARTSLLDGSDGDGDGDTEMEEGSDNHRSWALDLHLAFEDTKSLVNALFRLTLYIRNPSRRDQLRERDLSAVAAFEAFDRSFIAEKYRAADVSLTKLLGRANTIRRANLLYWVKRRDKRGGIEIAATDGGSTPATSEYQATTFQPYNEAETAEISSQISRTSYAESLLHGESVRRPELPQSGRDGGLFECPICFYVISVSGQREWMKHVFFDLQPYVCVFPHCKTPLLLYESRRAWFTHVLNSHLPSTDGASASDNARCPLCHDRIQLLSNFCRHLARHLEEIALFSLPSSLFAEDEDMEDSETEVPEGSSDNDSEIETRSTLQNNSLDDSSQDVAAVAQEEQNETPKSPAEDNQSPRPEGQLPTDSQPLRNYPSQVPYAEQHSRSTLNVPMEQYGDYATQSKPEFRTQLRVMYECIWLCIAIQNVELTSTQWLPLQQKQARGGLWEIWKNTACCEF
jgi:hypothetical protein